MWKKSCTSALPMESRSFKERDGKHGTFLIINYISIKFTLLKKSQYIDVKLLINFTLCAYTNGEVKPEEMSSKGGGGVSYILDMLHFPN